MSGWQYTPAARDMMNKNASRISDRWMRTAPARYAQLENPELYFEELGQLTLSRVDSLAQSLEASTPAPADEDYLAAVARRSSLTRQAEEIAMSELEWPEVELSLEEAREEWEATTPREEWLIEWASSLEESPADDELEEMSAEWILPVEYLRSLAAAMNPWTYSAEHSATMAESHEARFQLYLRS